MIALTVAETITATVLVVVVGVPTIVGLACCVLAARADHPIDGRPAPVRDSDRAGVWILTVLIVGTWVLTWFVLRDPRSTTTEERTVTPATQSAPVVYRP